MIQERYDWLSAVRRQIEQTLFDQASGMLYDYISSYDHACRFDHLPTTEEVALDFPNPCGWGTGMEDCSLNGGLLLDYAYAAGEINGPFACRIAMGLIRNGTVHGKNGFIARGITNYDNYSCYKNSSRDQFTLATYGLWRFVSGNTSDKELRGKALGLLLDVADYCEKNVVAENNYKLMRLDGKDAVVSKMWHTMPHEAMRLPMIYGIAAELSRNTHYDDLLRRCVRSGLEQTLTADVDGDWWDMPLIQMQLSLNFFRQSRIVPEICGEINHAMKIAAGIAAAKLPQLLAEAETYTGSWCEIYENWRKLPMLLRESTLNKSGRPALFGGKSYMNPVFDRRFAKPNELLRGIGNYMAISAMCDDITLAPDTITRADAIAQKIDFSRFAGAGTVSFLYGYTALSAKKTQTIQHEAFSV